MKTLFLIFFTFFCFACSSTTESRHKSLFLGGNSALIYFHYNQAGLTEKTEEIENESIEKLRKFIDSAGIHRNFAVVGFISHQGAPQTQMMLAAKRIRSVYQFMTEMGVQEHQIYPFLDADEEGVGYENPTSIKDERYLVLVKRLDD